MKPSLRNRIILIRVVLSLAILVPAKAISETTEEMNSWAYHQKWDKLTNTNYSLARSPVPRRGANDNLRIEFICKNNALSLSVDALSLITSQGSQFKFEYQVDRQASVSLSMRTYNDSKRRGYTDQQIERIVADILTGQAIYIRVHTLIRTVLTSRIPMDNATQPIQQVLADCNTALPGGQAKQSAYSLNDFEQDFNALSPEKRQQVLEKIQTIMKSVR